MIAETGSAPDARKAAWVADTLRSARADRLGAVVWFEFDKETDWRLGADPASADAAGAVVRGPGWRTGRRPGRSCARLRARPALSGAQARRRGNNLASASPAYTSVLIATKVARAWNQRGPAARSDEKRSPAWTLTAVTASRGT